MKTPPFLVGGALLFWGWNSDFLVVGAVMGVVLEGSRFLKVRWELSNEDFSRAWVFCTLLFLAMGTFAFSSNDGPSNIRGMITSGGYAAVNNVGTTSAKTAILMIRWLPMAFFLFMAAQAFSTREGIPLETISLILRRRWKRAKKESKPPPVSRSINIAYPYFILCLFAACSHHLEDNHDFYWGLCLMTAWGLWSVRSRRFGLIIWAGAIAASMFLSRGGQMGLVQMQKWVANYNPTWLGGFFRQPSDPTESRTQIGQIGRIKTSSRIVIRLETTNSSPPAYLREAVFRSYKATVWYAGGSKGGFANVTEEPLNSGNWPLVPGRSNTSSFKIACYLPQGGGLLPLPESVGRLEQLPAYIVQMNASGAVRAEGPGLVIFNSLHGPGETVDAPPDTNEDLLIPEREKPALDEIITDLKLEGMTQKEQIRAIGSYFAVNFTYSLWQQRSRIRDTNSTSISRFLKQYRSGHCEYFATATVLLLRELNIPARYTVGYAVHEQWGKGYVVRQSDAHAWCRVWNENGKQWEDFDTTPGVWLEREHDHQSRFQFISDAWSRLVFEFSKLRWGQSRIRQYILMALVPVLVLLLYQIIFRSGKRKISRKPLNQNGPYERPGADSEFYRLESELAKTVSPRAPNESLSLWLRRSARESQFSKITGPLNRILLLHYRYRFDPKGLDTEDRESLRHEVALCLEKIGRG